MSSRLSLEQPERSHFDPSGPRHRMFRCDIDRFLDAVAFENVEADEKDETPVSNPTFAPQEKSGVTRAQPQALVNCISASLA